MGTVYRHGEDREEFFRSPVRLIYVGPAGPVHTTYPNSFPKSITIFEKSHRKIEKLHVIGHRIVLMVICGVTLCDLLPTLLGQLFPVAVSVSGGVAADRFSVLCALQSTA